MSPPLHRCVVLNGPVSGVHAVHMHSNRAFDRHCHDSFGFGLMDAGGQVSASGRGPVESLAGNVITTNPGEIHDGVPLQRRPRCWRMVYVSTQLMADAVGLDTVELTRPVLEDAELRQTVDALLRHWAPTQGPDSGAEEMLTHTLGMLVQRYGNRALPDVLPSTLCAVRESLLDQMDAPPSLEALSKLAGLSRFQLVRQFARTFGLPPFAWLQQQRLHRAQARIAKGYSLTESALSCGFADQSHMTRAFQRFLGYTPGMWQHAQHRLQ
ncbi:AraC family transcriptional regulator [Rhodoferax sp. GW822-FHT02A01]|uniref:AraC family transcriptional regulator n=1 Tax=Rhodoferax sp. GW822-FHT02A01 TaxID=3141537 RepID=UPI00315C668B